jgi:hypothetical protein
MPKDESRDRVNLLPNVVCGGCGADGPGREVMGLFFLGERCGCSVFDVARVNAEERAIALVKLAETAGALKERDEQVMALAKKVFEADARCSAALDELGEARSGRVRDGLALSEARGEIESLVRELERREAVVERVAPLRLLRRFSRGLAAFREAVRR